MAPKGFKEVTFAITADPDAPNVTCLVCETCQALILQGDFGNYAHKHWKWHKKLEEVFSMMEANNRKLNEIADALDATISSYKLTLPVEENNG